tara:strand:+ start:244 stop:357 length:114 start_codon:yes stop_codon:yes gene_type:complete
MLVNNIKKIDKLIFKRYLLINYAALTKNNHLARLIIL